MSSENKYLPFSVATRHCLSMKANGLLLCRSLSATAVCASDDPRSMTVSRRGEAVAEGSRLIDFRYSRLGESRRLMSSGERRRPSVKLAMVAKKDKLAPSSNHHELQVVVMRVSLHCNGCARKVRRHISKMEGVTSFSVDLESKRVTVMGHVSPVGVLESISKVKKAEFWPCSC